jgi:hypothetical protein
MHATYDPEDPPLVWELLKIARDKRKVVFVSAKEFYGGELTTVNLAQGIVEAFGSRVYKDWQMQADDDERFSVVKDQVGTLWLVNYGGSAPEYR